MKKLTLLTALLFALCVALPSCKSHEKCPAYTKVSSPSLVKKSV